MQVEAAGERVESALLNAFEGISEYSQQHDTSKTRPALVYDPVNVAVWIKLDKKSQVNAMLIASGSGGNNPKSSGRALGRGQCSFTMVPVACQPI